MIQFLGVTKIYPAHPEPIKALDNVSFEISEGEFVFLVGHSGSGKTTILRQLIREESPSEGKIFFDDVDITKLKRSGIYKLRRQIGIVFQDYKLIEDKTAYENVAFAMEAAGHSQREINETVPYVLDIVNLGERSEAFPKQLSGGEKQRIAIARAIANNPKLLIADEPTGNLDPDSAWDIVQILAKINKWGTTVLMSTHGTEIVNSLQKRVLKIEAGRLVRDDKKGLYDAVDEFSLKVLQKQEEGEEPKLSIGKQESKKTKSEKEPAKEEKEAEVPTKTKEIVITEAVIELGEPTEQAESKPETKSETTEEPEAKSTDKPAEKPKTKPTKKVKVKQALSKADQSGLASLKLPAELVGKLVAAGYKDVEDILSAGVGKVNENLSGKEIRQLARAIKKFVTTE
jgi:cell division transport system ATP-binding protein